MTINPHQPLLEALSDEEKAEWLLHPVTQTFRAELTDMKAELQRQWANGGFSHDTEFKTALASGSAAATCQFIDMLLELGTPNPETEVKK